MEALGGIEVKLGRPITGQIQSAHDGEDHFRFQMKGVVVTRFASELHNARLDSVGPLVVDAVMLARMCDIHARGFDIAACAEAAEPLV